MKSYPLYKNTGLSWIDEVPQEWKKVAIKFLASDKNSIFIDGDWIESNDITDSDSIRYITTGNVGVGRYIEKGNSFISEETFSKLRCKGVESGDILISRLNLPIGRSCIAPNLGQRVVTSVDNVILRSDDAYDRRFLVYLFSNPDYLNNAENLARGTTMQRISRTQLGNIRIFVPESLSEQKSIADFLDRTLAPVDSLIFEKQKFISLLKEKRQALISHVVTKGLDADVVMKDSGVEWIGEIPKHWTTSKLKHVSTCNDEALAESTDGNFEIEYVDIGSVKSDKGIVKSETLKFSDAPSRARRIVRDQDIIISTVRTYLKAIAPIDDPSSNLIVSTGFAVIRPKLVDSRYAKYFLMSSQFIHEVIVRSTGVGYPAITATNLMNIDLTIPDQRVQVEISDFLDQRIHKINSLIDETSKSIELLKEHRTALISAAVTGKIDLRKKEVA
ncbi:restriction endonuclease subunit S [Marinobacter sp. MDS2]|uniref:restriction endonuclease subunit S n=1 Tax=Marinobacter sp. MDS2 TaxID=3065961 RepID=UPI00273BF4BE|nr:restriction endonuclease subunit S [Marinobacter sp. MDS2]MDP4549059.1 restriction endonuclease subunit S [Marinobacter sp. MDS2]